MLVTEIDCECKDIIQELEKRCSNCMTAPRGYYAVIDGSEITEWGSKKGYSNIQIHAVNRAHSILIADRALKKELISWFIDNLIDRAIDEIISNEIDFKDRQEAIQTITDLVIEKAFKTSQNLIYLQKVKPCF